MTNNDALLSRVQRWQDMPSYARNDLSTFHLIRDLASALQLAIYNNGLLQARCLELEAAHHE